MHFTTLVDTSTLSRHLSDVQWVTVDCCFRLDDIHWGDTQYLANHIPGAVRADLDRDLAGVKTGTNGRHPLPDPDALVSTLGRLGIETGVQVIAYDQDTGMYASRLWWLLRWLGHERAAVLDGGLATWIAEGRPTVQGPESRAPRTFTGTPRPGMTVSADEVTEINRSRGGRLVDARAADRYRGDVEMIDSVAGHIPGASNHYFKLNLKEGGGFRSPDDLRALWAGTLGGGDAKRVVCYCGSGVTACHNLLALEHAGLPGAKLYPGSWSEWTGDPARPTERG